MSDKANSFDERLRGLKQEAERRQRDFDRRQRESEESNARIDRNLAKLEELVDSLETGEMFFRVNKRTHRIRFEGETEESVTIVIEPKGENDS